ncbi:hypothetical protein [Ensifer sp. BR816]|uniref:hypothetical protein n=1 Tax=Rhizobium sp. (strain BR816) TaxID=1057002 RepID=UPI0003A3A6C9|nr:hypothetical protein [Ensifer sp. BR816]
MTRHNIFHVIQTAVLNRLLLIIIALMIASPFVVLPIKGCTTSGSQTGSAPMEISAPPETS